MASTVGEEQYLDDATCWDPWKILLTDIKRIHLHVRSIEKPTTLLFPILSSRCKLDRSYSFECKENSSLRVIN
jgi:hypothetical protein